MDKIDEFQINSKPKEEAVYAYLPFAVLIVSKLTNNTFYGLIRTMTELIS